MNRRPTHRRWPGFAGICAGLLLAAGMTHLLPGPQAAMPGEPTGAVLSECDGALDRLVIHYHTGAQFALDVYRDFLPRLPADVTVLAVCPDESAWQELRWAIGSVECTLTPVITRYEITAWSRDRWIALAPAAAGRATTLLTPAAEEGAEIWPARAGDARVAGHLAEALANVRHQRGTLLFDGGDILADNRCAFISPAVLRRNLQHTVESESQLIEQLERQLGRRVVVLPDAPDHHAGMFMMAAGNGTVLVGDPSLALPLVGADLPALPGEADFTAKTQRRFDSVAERATEAGYRVVRIPTIPAADGRSFLTYVNVLIDQRDDRRIVYMPVYRGAEALNAAAAEVWRSVGFQVQPIDCTSTYLHFGNLHCLVNVLQRR
jgi:hypothetical protein